MSELLNADFKNIVAGITAFFELGYDKFRLRI